VNMAALAAVFLVLGGGLLVASAVTQTVGRRRMISSRLAGLRVEMRPTLLIHDAESLDRPQDRDRLRQFLTWGMKQTWGVKRTGATLAIIAALTASALLALQLAISTPLWVAVPLALALGYGICRFLVLGEQRRCEARFLEYFPTALDNVVRVLRAGLPTTAAIRAVAEEAPAAVAEVFAEMADQLDIGVSVAGVLAHAGGRIQLSDFRFFTASVALQHGTGGNLASTLETLTEIIRRRRGVRLKVRALTAEVRMSSYVLGAVPVVVLAGLAVVVPQYLTPLFHDPRGKLILGIAACNLAAGFFTMRVLMRRAALD